METAAVLIAIFTGVFVAIFVAIFLPLGLSGRGWRVAQYRARRRRIDDAKMNARLLSLNI